MIKFATIMVLISCTYLAYKNFVEGSRVEGVAMEAVHVCKHTAELGQDGLDNVNDKVHQVLK